MANSGTYDWNPGLGSLALAAFARCQVRRTELTATHMQDAWLEANLLQSDWAADGILWWTVELITQDLTQGVGTYSVPARVISVLDVYVSPGGADTGMNRLITPFSRTDYASLSNPNEQGFPTSFWYNRALSPEIVLWPVPDNNTTYSMSYYAYTQIQDATFANGGNAAVPNWWLSAYVADLAHRLSRIYAPGLEAQRKADRDEAYNRACKQAEPVPLYFTTGLEGYFR